MKCARSEKRRNFRVQYIKKFYAHHSPMLVGAERNEYKNNLSISLKINFARSLRLFKCIGIEFFHINARAKNFLN
jgi:hypothetical protein